MLKPTAQYIRETFTLDDKGRLIWNVRPRNHFTPKPKGQRAFELFNAKNAGNPVKVSYDEPDSTIKISGHEFQLETIIYLLTYDDFDGEVIFKNGKRNDYRPSNLIAVSFADAEKYWAKVDIPQRACEQPIDLNDLNELISYDETNGKFYWKRRDVRWFDGDEKKALKFNKEAVGKECFNREASHGGFFGTVMGRTFTRELLVWLFEHQEMPDGIIVHKDLDPKNCYIGNLRVVPFNKAPKSYRCLEYKPAVRF